MLRRLCMCLLLVTVYTQFIFAQYQKITEFSQNRQEYLSQLEELMTSSKRTVLENAFASYEKSFQTGLFTEEEFAQVLKTSNTMLQQRMGASPYFVNYLKALEFVKSGKSGAAQFKSWHEVLDQMLADIKNRKLNPYKNFLEFSRSFFEFNALRGSKSGTNWIAKADRVVLKYEDQIPFVEYENLDLMAIRKEDSIMIYETSGRFYPDQWLWKGTGGKVKWDRYTALKDVYCILGEYSIDMKKSLYNVPSVQLYYPELFPNGPIEGTLSNKLAVQNKKTGGSYPRFESKDSVLSISNIGAGIQYRGGFRLHGTTVYGIGRKNIPAQIILYRDSTEPIFKASAELFAIRKEELIAGERVETVLYFDQDSIYHPSLNFKFDIVESVMKVNRGDRGSDRNPFYSSYNKMNIDTDRMDWYIDRDSIVIGSIIPGGFQGNKKVTFESLEFFDAGDYRRIQNIANYNPISSIKVIAEKEGTNILHAEHLAKMLNPRFSASSIQTLLYDLVAQGFVNYDHDRQIVEVKEKVRHYADASQEKVDYDVLKLVSETSKENAVFDLKSKKTMVKGVKNVEFSVKQKVALKPIDNHVLLKGNRDLDFDGKVYAGFAQFEGKEFTFEYDKFQINMDSIRYFDLFIPSGEKNKHNEDIAVSIGSRLEHTSGVLLIDAPSNKSGKENIKMFPSYQSRGTSYVYYDRDSTMEGVYDRDSFYFKLNEFSFNSLDSFSLEDIQFTGSMVSADIFPEFNETLRLLKEDESLGFVTQSPPEGYPNYQGKGNFKGEIALSNSGFLGKGKLSYLGASVDSEDIVFRPKQLTASAENFHLDEDRSGPVEVPQVDGHDVLIDWRPYKDSMYIRTKVKAFDLFKAQAHTLTGTAILTPDGLKGRGSFDWKRGRIKSNLFNFGAFSLLADTSDVQIKTFHSNDLAFDAKNVWSKVDFEEMKGQFKANSPNGTTTMPYNKYETTLDNFDWDMRNETVNFISEDGEEGLFTSIHPDQDSLQFAGKAGFYDLKTSILEIQGIDRIFSVDSWIYPDSGYIEIRPGGILSGLSNARIVASTENEYHVINRASVEIKGKRNYKARGFYEYNIGDRKQEIEFANIVGQPYGKGDQAAKMLRTEATAEIKVEDNFYMDHKTRFRGQITLKADQENLKFDGFAKFDAPDMMGSDWFSISNEVDKNNVVIAFDEPKSLSGDPIRAGMYLSKDRSVVYPRTMMPLYSRQDRAIMDSRGVFRYDTQKDQFLFGDSSRVIDGRLVGNLLTYNNKDGNVVAEGSFEVGAGLGNVAVNAAGRMSSSFDPAQNKITAEFMAGITMGIPDKLLRIMINDVRSSTFDANPIDYTSRHDDFYDLALAQLITDEKAWMKTVEDLKMGAFEIPKKYNPYTFFFSDLDMVWEPDYQSFVSTETRIGLSSILGEPVNSALISFIEFKMTGNMDDRVSIYIKSPSDYFYFFAYKKGILNICSNNQRFNDAVAGMKKKELVIKGQDGQSFEIQPVEISTAERFARRVEAIRK